MTDATLQAFISARCSTLEELELHWHEQLTDTSLQFIARHCSNLSSLNLCGVKTITNDVRTHTIRTDVFFFSNQRESVGHCAIYSATNGHQRHHIFHARHGGGRDVRRQ